MIKLNKTNLILSITFITIGSLIVRHIFNNIEQIVQLKLDVLYTFMCVVTTANFFIALYFLSISVEKVDLLEQFYTDIWDAIAKPNKYRWFNPEAGLCHNFISFQEHHGIDKPSLVRLHKQFKQKGYTGRYPFNKSSSEYYTEVIYQNTKRLNWIKFHIKEKV